MKPCEIAEVFTKSLRRKKGISGGGGRFYQERPLLDWWPPNVGLRTSASL